MTYGLIVTDEILRCPLCGEAETHLDTAHISARGEDEPFVEIAVNGITGYVDSDAPPGPVGEIVGEGRRNRFSLSGYCEHCLDRFAIIFTQHKGTTYVEAVRSGTRDPYGDPE